MKLEKKIAALLGDLPENTRFDVIAHELWGNAREGLSVNDSWKIARDTDTAGLLEACRGRWEVFKINYAPRARVSDLQDVAESGSYLIECAGIPFLEIRPLASELTEDVAAYARYLRDSGPVCNNGHTRLKALWDKYGREAVDAEIAACPVMKEPARRPYTIA